VFNDATTSYLLNLGPLETFCLSSTATWTAIEIEDHSKRSVIMAFKQQVAVADIVKTLLATNQRLITKQEALQCFDEVFRQASEADQVLEEELTQAYVS
jgi:hypothetical protein